MSSIEHSTSLIIDVLHIHFIYAYISIAFQDLH